MTSDHRACDEQFANLENMVDSKNFDGAKTMFEEFQTHMLKHFSSEEDVIFPAFNASGADGCNPTGVMIMEHDQMRELMKKMEQSLASHDQEKFLGLSENLLFVMQQHNMKEEQIMYNLVDNALDAEQLIEKIESL